MALFSGTVRPAVLAMLALLAISLVAVPTEGKTHSCKDISSANKECSADLVVGDEFVMDCSASKDVVVPTGLLSTLDTKLCKSPAKWTKAETACADSDILGQLSLAGKGVAVTAVKDILTIVNQKFSEGEMRLSGSCSNSDKSKSGFFNVTVKSSAFSSLTATASVLLAVLATGFISTTF